MKNTPIKDIMSAQVLSITTQSEILEARDLMKENNIHHLPVLNDGKLIGIISSNDISQIEFLCDFVGEKLQSSTIFKSLSVHEIMSKNVASLTSDALVSEAILVFSNENFHCLPITEQGKLIGIVTAKDVFRLLELD